MVGKIGVLALQGAFKSHLRMLEGLSVPAREVRYPGDLDDCVGLILPGGESTTISLHLEKMGLLESIREFAINNPLFGTCAGMILMSCKGPLDLIDIEVDRNAFGRQKESFSTLIPLQLKKNSSFQAIFIRAPRIKRWGKDVKTLSSLGEEPVFVRQGNHLATSFHPELTNDPTIHQYFIQICMMNFPEKQLPQRLSKTTPTKSFQTI